ncbi:hypothetical protein RRG08_026382 [Elysia crispata]|uniref:Uncharacterized protein n=1 Tax=Elysia crispata TaxID=231223 RepID=A0AAE0XRL3_9GAST|nr:hypothetical protein RRG08_026382 [Elysia crispata]
MKGLGTASSQSQHYFMCNAVQPGTARCSVTAYLRRGCKCDRGLRKIQLRGHMDGGDKLRLLGATMGCY